MSEVTFYHISKNYSKPIVVTKEVFEDRSEKYFINFDVDGFNLEKHEISTVLFDELIKLHQILLAEKKTFESKFK